ncbi:MAG: methylthioribulose-1-phosphate dehydratase, partial [Gammaproteobacteria bacterium HGW-Gammaproteobacteria-8]
SAEAGLHVQIYLRCAQARAVLHVHSPIATVASRRFEAHGAMRFVNYELLKAFEGVSDHDLEFELPVVGNDQNIDRLAASIEPRLGQAGTLPGYLIAGHGVYAWGRSVDDAARHLEALDFLIQCELSDNR